MKTTLLIRLGIIIAIAILATLSTGLVLTLTIGSAAGEILTYYGLPFAWKENVDTICGPLNQPCQSDVNSIQYNWGLFAIDVLLFAALGYGILLIWADYLRERNRVSTFWNRWFQSKTQTRTNNTT